MSNLKTEKQKRTATRILLLAYLFNKYLGRGLPNHVATYYERDPSTKTLGIIRDSLIKMGLIKMVKRHMESKTDTKPTQKDETTNSDTKADESVEKDQTIKSDTTVDESTQEDKTAEHDTKMYLIDLTEAGKAELNKIFAIDLGGNTQFSPDDEPELTFVKKIKPISLLLARVRPEEAVKFFKTLALLYADGFIKKDNIPVFIKEMADDVANGYREFDKRLARGIGILYYDFVTGIEWWMKRDEKLENYVTEVIGGNELLKRVATLFYIWKFYRFNTIFLHTVVRYASFFLLGSLQHILRYFAAASFGIFFFILLLMLGLITTWTLVIVGIVVGILLFPHLLLIPPAMAPILKYLLNALVFKSKNRLKKKNNNITLL